MQEQHIQIYEEYIEQANVNIENCQKEVDRYNQEIQFFQKSGLKPQQEEAKIGLKNAEQRLTQQKKYLEDMTTTIQNLRTHLTDDKKEKEEYIKSYLDQAGAD